MARVPYITPETASGEVADLLAKLESQGPTRNVIRALANSPATFRNFVRFASSLIRFASLPGKDREIVIMRIAQRVHAPYEARQHHPMALEARVSPAQLASLAKGDVSGPEFDDRERAIIKFADEALEMRVSDETFTAAREHLDDAQITELALTVGWWGGLVPRFIDALGVEIEHE